jgi:DnaJ-class molecular chaperone
MAFIDYYKILEHFKEATEADIKKGLSGKLENTIV